VSAFANRGRAVAHVRGSYVPTADMVVLFRHLENRGVRSVVQSKFGYDDLRSIHSLVLA
jgi:hypothetical protein